MLFLFRPLTKKNNTLALSINVSLGSGVSVKISLLIIVGCTLIFFVTTVSDEK